MGVALNPAELVRKVGTCSARQKVVRSGDYSQAEDALCGGIAQKPATYRSCNTFSCLPWCRSESAVRRPAMPLKEVLAVRLKV